MEKKSRNQRLKEIKGKEKKSRLRQLYENNSETCKISLTIWGDESRHSPTPLD